MATVVRATAVDARGRRATCSYIRPSRSNSTQVAGLTCWLWLSGRSYVVGSSGLRPKAAFGDAAVSVLEEFRRTGRVGDELARLAYRTIRAVARTHNFPHPANMHWGREDAGWDAVSRFFTDADGEARLIKLCNGAENDAHLYSLLETTVLRWLQTLGRQTERGRLIRALTRVLDDEGVHFTEVAPGKFWALTDGPTEPTTVDLDDLVDAAGTVHVDIIPARPDAKKRSPWASREQQVEVLRAVLEAAGGAVHINDIAQVIVNRIGLREKPHEQSVDDPSAAEPGLTDERLAEVAASDRIRDVFEQLNERERAALAYYDAPVREAAEMTGIPRSSLQDAKARLEDTLYRELDLDDYDAVRGLRRMCLEQTRTDGGGLASTSQDPEDDER